MKEEDQRMEIVSRNSMTFLAPISDREATQINLYFKWEQAFRIYSNILTTKLPGKATELLQYNHMIQTASTSYAWENVYSYDREFRQHIGRHLVHPWNIILQQAWTMILKDRIKGNQFFQKGKSSNKRDREP